MIVDCDRCEVRGEACGDCVITVLLGAPPEGVELDCTDRRALDTLAEAGMVPRLQLIDRDEYCDVTRARTKRASTGAERSVTRGERSTRHVS